MIPAHLLYPLTWRRAVSVVDPVDGSEGTSHVDTMIAGRITRGTAREATESGREASVGGSTLITNEGGVGPNDQVQEASGAPWEIVGQPVAVHDADSIHHYEVPVRRVAG